MIGTVNIEVNAANPGCPLNALVAHLDSPSQVRVLNVPKKIGLWEIKEVFVAAEYPDNKVVSVAATRSGGVWSATLQGAAEPGIVKKGFTVLANGIDENGAAVTGYVLGVGDVLILDRDSTIHAGSTTYYVHILDEKPATPHKGDLVKTDDGWEIFDGSAWIGFGGGGSGGGATVLTTNGSKIFKGGVEMTSYAALLALVQAGGVTLMGTVGADKDALYYPLFCDTNAIRFDATGTLGGDVKTKSYTVQPVNGDSIRVSVGALVDLAKKSDIPTSMPWGSVTGKPTVFPPESHSHESTEIKVKDGENELPLVVAPSADAKTGQAAGALETRNALPLFFDHDPAKSVFTIDENGYPMLDQVNYDTRYHFPQDVDKDVYLAHIGQFADKLTDDDLKTLCTTCGISLTKPDGTPKTRAELLIDLFGESNSQLAKTIREKVLADGEGEIKAALFADTAFSDKVQEIVNGMFDNADTTQYGEN